jgi:hypothetical protein
MPTSASAASRSSTPPKPVAKIATPTRHRDTAARRRPSTRLSPLNLKPGDIIGFSGNHWASIAINLVTYGIPFWHLSHVGMVGEHRGELVLFESCISDPQPCLIRGEHFSGTQAHKLDSVLSYNGKVWHYPLCRPLYDDERQRLSTFLHSTIGTPYDAIGAFRSGGLGFSFIESLLRNQDLSSLFCSEWCAAALCHIGLFATDNVSRWSPNKFVRAARRQAILCRPQRIK